VRIADCNISETFSAEGSNAIRGRMQTVGCQTRLLRAVQSQYCRKIHLALRQARKARASRRLCIRHISENSVLRRQRPIPVLRGQPAAEHHHTTGQRSRRRGPLSPTMDGSDTSAIQEYRYNGISHTLTNRGWTTGRLR